VLVIRKEQWDSMEGSLHLSFEERAMAELRSTYPKRLQNVEDEELREDVRVGRSRAQEFGITDDGFVMQFLEFIVEYGRGFAETEETTWAREILENEYYDEEEKLSRLSRHRILDIFGN
jgi:hypothetical protein